MRTLLLAFLVLLAAPLAADNPSFYLATDKSFGATETPYVNLEAPGSRELELRLYRVDDPAAFLKERVEARIVKEETGAAHADPAALFQNSWNYFKADFREIARTDLNVKSRSGLRKALKVEFRPGETGALARPALLARHTYLSTIRIPAIASDWAYRRIPVPIAGKGMFLVEALSGDEIAYTVVLRSDYTFLTKQSHKDTLVYAARSDTGQPARDAQIRVLDANSGGQVFAGATNDQGFVRFAGGTPEKSLIVLSKDGQYALSDPDFFTSSFYGKGGLRVLTYTDRPIYRPGDHVYFKSLFRDFRDDRYAPGGGGATYSIVDDAGKFVLENRPVAMGGVGTGTGDFDLPDHENVSLGTYSILVNQGGKSYSADFQVEAYKKPKFITRVKTSKPNYRKSETIAIHVQSRYYYGKPLAKAGLNVRVFRAPKYDFSPVGHFDFAAASAFLGQTGGASRRDLVLDKNAQLDDDGRFELELEPKDVDQDYTYTAIATVTAPDQTLSGRASFAVHRSPFFIRIRQENAVYNPDEKAKIGVELVPYDRALKPEQVEELLKGREVVARLYRRSFYWISEEGQRNKIETYETETDEKGRAEFDVTLPDSGHFALIIEAEDPDGGTTDSTVTMWASGKQDSIQEPFKNLVLKPGKDIYRPGDTAEVLVMSPAADGHIFLTVEGTNLYRQETVQLKGNTLKYKIKIDETMSPNFVLAAGQFHDGALYKSEVKIVAPPADKFLTVKVAPDKAVYRPGEAAELSVSTVGADGKGRTAEVSLAVVDSAIYQLAADRTPDLVRFFYHPRRNDILTSFSSSFRFFGYSEDKRLKLALGRRGLPELTAIKDDTFESRRNFKDLAFWNARVNTDGEGKAKVKFILPDNLTEWKVTARAITGDTSIGETEASFIARKDLMLEAGLPAYMLEEREQQVVATVSNLTKNDHNVKVTVAAENAQVVGPAAKDLTLKAGASGFVSFAVKAGKGEAARVHLRAASGQLYDAADHRIALRPFGLPRIVSRTVRLKSGADEARAELELPAAHSAPDLKVRLSSGTGQAIRASLAYLADYPYGCVEQTMSRFMPLMGAARAGYINPKLKQQLPDMVRTGLTALSGFQRADGGFGWFGGEGGSDPMMSAYVFRGLAVSKSLGYDVKGETINRARSFLTGALNSRDLDPFQRAYILFSLSEGGKVADSMADKLYETLDKQSQYGRALTALVLISQGGDQNRKRAREIVASVNDKLDLTDSDDGADFSGRLFRSNYGAWQDDPVETTAAILTAALRLGLDENDIERLAATLLRNRRGEAWNNSRDTAWAVLALTEKLQKQREAETAADFTVRLNKAEPIARRVDPAAVNEGEPVIAFGRAGLTPGKNTLRFAKNEGLPLYVTALMSFFDGSKSFQPEEQGISIDRRFAKVTVKETEQGLEVSHAPTASFAQGDLVMVRMRVKRDGKNDTYFMIEDHVPPGFSVLRKDDEYYSKDRKREFDARKIYDDRVVFFAAGPANELTVRYFLRADLPGEYAVMPARANLMYYPEIRGSSRDDRVKVAGK